MPNAKYYYNNKEACSQYQKEYYRKNREHILANNKKWNHEHAIEVSIHGRKQKLKQKFGLSIAKYVELAKAQNYLCAICSQPPIETKSLAVDHCHETGKIRGLLCMKCNVALGMFHDDVTVILQAVRYLMKHRKF